MAIQVMYIYIMIYMHDTHFISCYDEVFWGLFVCLFFFIIIIFLASTFMNVLNIRKSITGKK